MVSMRQFSAMVLMGLVMQSPAVFAAEKAALPPSPAIAPKEPPAGVTEAQLEAAERADDRNDAQDATRLQELPGADRHGVRERVIQQGVFVDADCAKSRGETPYCSCAADISMPIFSRRVYKTSARNLSVNVWEYIDDELDTSFCPPNYSKRLDTKPETLRDTAGKAFFQHVEVLAHNKDYVSLVLNSFERDGDETPFEIKYGLVVDVKARRPLTLAQILGSKQDAALSKLVVTELKKQVRDAQSVKFSGGSSEEVDGFYLSPQGLVLQFGPGSVSAEDRTLSVTLPVSMIAQPALRQLIQQPQG